MPHCLCIALCVLINARRLVTYPPIRNRQGPSTSRPDVHADLTSERLAFSKRRTSQDHVHSACGTDVWLDLAYLLNSRTMDALIVAGFAGLAGKVAYDMVGPLAKEVGKMLVEEVEPYRAPRR